MEITIRQEAGYELALYGMSLSFKDRSIKPEDWWCLEGGCVCCDSGMHDERLDYDYPCPSESCDTCELDVRKEKITKAATQNANRGMGHNKFRRQVVLWVDIEAPRFFWSEFDTYKISTVAQSESTMHTLNKRKMQVTDLEPGGGGLSDQSCCDIFNEWQQSEESIEIKKRYVPESYLQRRLVTLNYEVLACIINQRKNHKLPQWREFIEAIYSQCEHPEILPEYPY